MKVPAIPFMTLAAVALALSASGCMWSRMRVNDPEIAGRAAAIRPGETPMADVPRILKAQPTMRIPGKDVNVFGFTYADTKSNGLVLILFNFTRSTTVAETLYVEGDVKSGLVTRIYVPSHPEAEWRFWPFGE